MSSNVQAVGLNTLLGALAADADRSRRFIEQRALGYHMPEVGADLKVALTAIGSAQSGHASLRVQSIAPGQSKVPVSAISTRLVACPGHSDQTPNPEFAVSHASVVGSRLRIVFVSDINTYRQAPVEVNLETSVADAMNGRPLNEATRVLTPYVLADEQGHLSVEVHLEGADRAGSQIPLRLGGELLQQTFLFSSDL